MNEKQKAVICRVAAFLQKNEHHAQAGELFQAFSDFDKERWEESGLCIHVDDGNPVIFTCNKCGFVDGP